MFRFAKQMFVSAVMFSGCSISNTNSLKCVSTSNQEYKIRPEIIDINSNEPSFYPYSIKVNKSIGSCYNINDPYSKMCAPDVVKSINVKVFTLISRTIETRHIK